MAQTDRISRNNTRIESGPGGRQVWLHKTCILEERADGSIRLYTGGWNTVTTRTRINQAANEWRLGFQVGFAGGRFTARVRFGENDYRELESADNRELIIPAR